LVKCLECGFESSRLQWTHFKYKCTGRFKNGTEYMRAYPYAKVVDEELAKKTSITEVNFISKYGEEEGIKRWDEYRKKQAYSNSLEYKQKKHGWTKEQFDEFNSSRAVTLEKCIERHGENIGTIIWDEYCQRQAYTNTKEYFIEKYGLEFGIEKYLDVNKWKGSSLNPKTMAERMNITEDESIEIILSRSSCSKFGSHIEKEFTEQLEKITGKLEYTTYSRPYGKWSHLLDSFVIYDIKHKDCIIEFNGDYWHCNPELYESTYIVRDNITASSIWEKDKKKIQTAIDLGFRVMVIWESEYKKDKIETVERVAKWIQNGQK